MPGKYWLGRKSEQFSVPRCTTWIRHFFWIEIVTSTVLEDYRDEWPISWDDGNTQEAAAYGQEKKTLHLNRFHWRWRRQETRELVQLRRLTTPLNGKLGPGSRFKEKTLISFSNFSANAFLVNDSISINWFVVAVLTARSQCYVYCGWSTRSRGSWSSAEGSGSQASCFFGKQGYSRRCHHPTHMPPGWRVNVHHIVCAWCE